MAAYKALFDAITHFERNISERLNVPTVIFIDMKDEFISYQKLKDMIDQNKLNRWEIHNVQKDDNVVKNTTHHLIIDEDSTSKNLWGQIQSVTLKHLLPVNRR